MVSPVPAAGSDAAVESTFRLAPDDHAALLRALPDLVHAAEVHRADP